MYLSSYVHIGDIDHQNSMTEINSFDIYSWQNSQFMIRVKRSFNQLHETNHLVVEWHLKLYFWMIWRYLKSEV